MGTRLHPVREANGNSSTVGGGSDLQSISTLMNPDCREMTQNLIISCRCFAENGKEMYKDL